MEYGEPIYVNQGKMNNLYDETVEAIASKYGVSLPSAGWIIKLFYMDKLRGDEYGPDDFSSLEELHGVGLVNQT